jgi:hypothetical protein
MRNYIRTKGVLKSGPELLLLVHEQFTLCKKRGSPGRAKRRIWRPDGRSQSIRKAQQKGLWKSRLSRLALPESLQKVADQAVEIRIPLAQILDLPDGMNDG